jgi:nucleoside-diphosphate-sugar epimerase
MTDELLTASATGRVRIAIGRAADLFGPGVTESSLGRQFFPNAVAGKKVDFIGNPDLLHTYSYVPDVAAALAVLGTDERAVGEVWHLPGPETVTTRSILELVETRLGRPVGIRIVPRLALRALGLVNPMMRGLAEMAYEFEEPFVLDTTKYRSMFGGQTTPLGEAVATTVESFQRSAQMATS